LGKTIKNFVKVDSKMGIIGREEELLWMAKGEFINEEVTSRRIISC